MNGVKIKLLGLFLYQEKILQYKISKSRTNFPVVTSISGLPKLLQKREDLRYALLKKDFFYYDGRFYPSNSFRFSGTNIQLLKRVTEKPDEYCLSKYEIFCDIPDKLMFEYYALNNCYTLAGDLDSDVTEEKSSTIFSFEYMGKNKLFSRIGLYSFRLSIKDMPADFGGALQFILDRMDVSREKLEEMSGVSARTITRMCTEPEYQPKLKSIVAICAGLKLFPMFSHELINRAGYSLNRIASDTDIAYKLIVNVLYSSGIDECNKFLEECGLEPLSKE